MTKPARPQISKGGWYPQAFGEEAVRYWLSSGQTLALVASDLGLSPECLRSWRKQLGADEAQDAACNPQNGTAQELAQAREIGQLRRELEAMTRQRDILKSYRHLCRDAGRGFEVIQHILSALACEVR